MNYNRGGCGILSLILIFLLFCPYTLALAETGDVKLTCYQGDGMFQAGSLEGPQEQLGSPAEITPFALRAERANPADELYENILSAFEACQTKRIIDAESGLELGVGVEVSLDGYSLISGDNSVMNSVYYLYAKAVNSHPRYFYYIPDVVFAESSGFLTKMYMLVNEDIYNDRTLYEDELAAMLREAVPDVSGMSDTEIALAVHDYLCSHVRYYYEVAACAAPYKTYPNSFSSYGTIIDKHAVCHGLSLAYKDMLSRFDIDSLIVPSYSSNPGHAWNLVCDDGKWYHVDLTYDSSFGTMVDPDRDSHIFGAVKHDFFMLSDSEIRSAGNHSSWYDSDLYSADASHTHRTFWNGIDSAMHYIGGRWYYNDGNYSALQKTSVGTICVSSYGAVRNPTILFSQVSFPVRLRNELYLFDHSDDTLYIYSPMSGKKRARKETTNGAVLGEMEFGALSPKDFSPVSSGMLYYVDAQGAAGSYYAKENLGDVNLDGAFDVLDALKLSGYAAGTDTPDEGTFDRADVNWDGALTEADASRVCEFVARLREGI